MSKGEVIPDDSGTPVSNKDMVVMRRPCCENVRAAHF